MGSNPENRKRRRVGSIWIQGHFWNMLAAEQLEFEYGIEKLLFIGTLIWKKDV
jgi:hypothetical protein